MGKSKHDAQSQGLFFGSAHNSSLNHSAAAAQAGYEWLSMSELQCGAERLGGMMVGSPGLRAVVAIVQRIAPHFSSVLVQGESGSGKELIAQALHHFGPDTQGPFVALNCSELVDSLAESQLFGHVKGAFTDAHSSAAGYFRAADGGTLFLDEIGELPLRLQPKLLRAVELHEVQPVGSARSSKVRVRIVAATNRDLRAMVRAGKFRDDLYYRLAATVVDLPPLRNRLSDIAPLVANFATRCALELDKPVQFISRRALNALCAHQWPGNIRELANVIRSAVITTDSDRICVEHLPNFGPDLAQHDAAMPTHADDAALAASATESSHQSSGELSLEAAIDRATLSTLLRALHDANGNCVRAARMLGVSRYTVYRMIARFGIHESYIAHGQHHGARFKRNSAIAAA